CCLAMAVRSLLSAYDVFTLIGVRSLGESRPSVPPRAGSSVHPYGRAAGDPLGHRLVSEGLALPARHRRERRDPVPGLPTAVAAVPLDLGRREAREGVDVGAGDLVQHPVVPLRVDPSALWRADPV